MSLTVTARAVSLETVPMRQVFRYMGMGGHAPDEALKALAADCLPEFLAAVRPRACYAQTSVAVDGDQVILGPLTVQSRKLARNLQGCDRAVWFAATLGADIDRQRRRMSVTSQARALVLDAMGSAGIEAVCDILCKRFAKEHPDRKLRPRFSPGYGDLPLDFQRPFLTLLDAQRKAGITLLDSLLMTPQKSVSAIVGLGPAGCEQGIGGCDECGRVDCEFRL